MDSNIEVFPFSDAKAQRFDNLQAYFEPLLEAPQPLSIPIGLVLTHYEDVNHVLRSKDEFCRTYWPGMEALHGSYVKDQYAFQIMADWLVELNPPAHARLRKLMQRPFSSANLETLKVQIHQIADALINTIKKKGDFDLVQDFALPLPVLVICRMLGIPSDDVPIFLKEPLVPARLLDPMPFDEDLVTLANERFYWLRDYFYPLFEERRKNPRDDVISMLVHEQLEGDRLSEAELLSNVILLFFAGHETTASLISAGMRELFLEPAQLSLLRSDFGNIDNAISEMLRLVSIAQMTIYTAAKDTVINGVPLEANRAAFCVLAAANRDPRVFEDPNHLNIRRENAHKHLAFGSGPHYCLGAHLARIEGAIAIEKILTAFPHLELLNLDQPKWRNSMALRALDEQLACTNE